MKTMRKYQKATQINAQRLLRAVDAAGLPDETLIHWSYSPETVGTLREYAAGKFPEDGRWYGERLAPDSLREPAKIARLLGCSTDYLLGLTDDLTPAAVPAEEDAIPTEVVEALLGEVSGGGKEIHPVWLPGKPEKSGPVAARFVLPGTGPSMIDLFWFDAVAGKYQFSETGATIDAECTGWWPVPDMEDDHAADASA